ncbi:MAG: hypothetical protein A2651_01755 [Candidatus Yanofskybacteria bacterium RIFCSPHIGHO2_01_FULL_42_12]|uniref:Uncharacterized protein n=1 Tax=Candidatus Yanofskybacteria bacterium RIFCSPLOWO2_01_FULL_42_49 TaxID=1802694 RepID=A0A1F8GC39_9BACT|nr:MAG: hypothetical protein A2651_01755 [Candidatus Yanofskybacteria bacterium RIFCSPHIGHO2_01_FULL_42_12]OGN22298.1 MAG: hypothetical protein A2918_00035 [Candidatus Yanofskybacteria bacterium RIFCSPLOWO2_01_FULL_42_49]
MRNVFFAVVTVVALALGFLGIAGCELFGNRASTTPASVVSDVSYGVASPARTELCVDNGATMRNWIFSDRWMKNQLTHDTYTVDDGRTYNAFRILTDDSTLPPHHVRFRKVVVNVGDGPTLEGHSYLRTLINGNPATILREILVVEFNGRLERQRRPLPPCGTPRS